MMSFCGGAAEAHHIPFNMQSRKPLFSKVFIGIFWLIKDYSLLIKKTNTLFQITLYMHGIGSSIKLFIYL
jgi:hypothetical protein